MPRVIREGRLVDDDFVVLSLAEGDTPHTVQLPAGPVLVPLAVWRARREELVRRTREGGASFGVWLAPNEGPETLVDDLADVNPVAVHFPKFADGRGYSTARLLRERYGYRGELRAFGDIGQDQLFYLSRVGFNAFALRETGEDLIAALGALHAFPEAYQAAANQPLPLFRRRDL